MLADGWQPCCSDLCVKFSFNFVSCHRKNSTHCFPYKHDVRLIECMQCASFQWRDIHCYNWRTIWPILFKMCTLTKHPSGPSAALILKSSLLRREVFGTLFNVVETWQKSVCQLINGVNFVAFIGHWKLKRLSASGGLSPPDGSTPGPRWGLRPQTPVIGSRSRARHAQTPSPWAPCLVVWTLN